ncbi:tripartite motif-containing protein 2-like [Mytilus edulis]|uniref:tripartite motif-containing protein 2-like n=1 Tax=Mytilus edulis TaxID=6550 RepID=UPI0039F0015C
MAESSQSCGVCDLRHIKKPCIVWCTECDEGLCSECKEHHSLSKSSRSHSVIPIAEYQKLPADVLKITQYCTSHDNKYQFYCQKHECPCCSTCIVECHKECREIVELKNVIRNAKSSNAMCEIEESLVEIAENLKKVRQHQQDNLLTFKEKRKEIEKELKKTRMKINNHLDKLQEDLIKQLNELEEKENSKICQLMASLEKKEKEIGECQNNLLNIKKHATDLQMFLSIKQIEEDVYSKEKKLQALVEGKEQHTLSYQINTSIQNIISDIRSFGEVRIESNPCDIVLIKKKARQAQLMIPIVPTKSIENIKVTIHKTINTQTRDFVYGCCILPDDRFVFTCYSAKQLKVFSNKGSSDFEIKMPCYPFDIVYIREDNTLAVSANRPGTIIIINLETKQMIKSIAFDSNIDGISLKGNQLIYSGENKCIGMINLNDESKSVIVRDKIPSTCYTATFRDNVYHTNNDKHTVICYNLQGEIQWTFHNESVLRCPRGIDVDSDGNVYVVGYGSNNVVVISPDGQQHREVLTTRDGLGNPTSLHYSGPNNQLLVANYNNNKAFLFNCN